MLAWIIREFMVDRDCSLGLRRQEMIQSIEIMDMSRPFQETYS
jgi:hypothetical protein